MTRTLGLYKSPAAVVLTGLATAVGLTSHLNFMLNVKFDYDWNVKVGCCMVWG